METRFFSWNGSVRFIYDIGRWLNRICEMMSRDNNAMHAKPDLRVVLEWKIAASGSVIVDVIRSEVFRSAIHSKRSFVPAQYCLP